MLWSKPKNKSGSFVATKAGKDYSIAYRLPQDYDETKWYPLLVVHPARVGLPQETIQSVIDLLFGSDKTEIPPLPMIVICPYQTLPSTFYHRAGHANLLSSMLESAQRRFHIDPQQIFAFGEGEGGQAAWISTLLHAHYWAGAMLFQSYPTIPYSEQVYPFLFENLRRMAILSIWNGTPHDQIYQGTAGITTYYNRRMAEIAQEMALPYSVKEQEAGSELRPTATEVAAMLKHRKPYFQKRVSHWFRYPAQGRVDWLRCVKMNANIWTESQLAIQPAVGEDRDRFIRTTVQHKMGWISAKVENQTITIDTQRVEKLELFLSAELIDLSGPITIIINGRTRYTQRVKLSMATMLNYAYANQQFDHLPTAKLTFNIHHDHVQVP